MFYFKTKILFLFFMMLGTTVDALNISVCSVSRNNRGDHTYRVTVSAGNPDYRYWIVFQNYQGEPWLQDNGQLGRVQNSSRSINFVVENRPGTFPATVYAVAFDKVYYEYLRERTSTGDWSDWYLTEADRDMVQVDTIAIETNDKGFYSYCD